MFKSVYKYFLSIGDSVSRNSKLNLWAFINIRNFKIKLSSYIFFYTEGLSNLKLKKISVRRIFLNFSYLLFIIFFIIFFIFTLMLLV